MTHAGSKPRSSAKSLRTNSRRIERGLGGVGRPRQVTVSADGASGKLLLFLFAFFQENGRGSHGIIFVQTQQAHTLR
jgi:hypothetical protein